MTKKLMLDQIDRAIEELVKESPGLGTAELGKQMKIRKAILILPATLRQRLHRLRLFGLISYRYGPGRCLLLYPDKEGVE